jgi:hypothetical protein
MKVVHYIPSIGKSGGGVSAYLQLLSHEHQLNEDRMILNILNRFNPSQSIQKNNTL